MKKLSLRFILLTLGAGSVSILCLWAHARWFGESGGPAVLLLWPVAVWTITQLKDPIAVFLSPSPSASWPSGYNTQSDRLPANLKMDGRILSLTRDPKDAHKIGSLANSLVWVGEKQALKISNAILPNAEYPDQGCSAEVYTNPDPLKYVELEMLGPLHEMRVGDKIRETRTYTLIHRENSDAGAEARLILGDRAE